MFQHYCTFELKEREMTYPKFTLIIAVALVFVFLGCSDNETREEYYPDGSLKAKWTEIKRKDGNFHKHGKYTAWYANGEKLQEQEFELGAMHGEFLKWFPNGQKHIKGEFKKNNQFGLWTWWYENGNKETERTYDERGFLNGPYKEWDDSGNLRIEGQYVNDKKHGKWIERNEDGSVKSEESWENGKIK